TRRVLEHVAQHDHGPVLGRQPRDPFERAVVGLGIRRRRVELAELDLGPEAAGPREVDRAVDDDAVQPRAERPAAVEAIEVAHGGEKRFLRDVLRGGGVAGDEIGGPESARPERAEQVFEVVDRPALGTPDPGALTHPPTLRRRFVTRSIRIRNLSGSPGRTGSMNRAALPFLLLALVLPGAASAAACSPLNCAPSQFVLAHGSLLAVRGTPDKPLRVIDLRTGRTRWWLPPGIVTGNTLVHQDGSLLTWLDAARGTRVADAMLQAHGAFTLVGTSQDAKRAVLARTQHRSTTFAIVSPTSERIVKLGGSNWQFDALNGRYLFLIQSLR